MNNQANLAKAVISVMKAVNGVEKNTTVGSGSYSYKGVSDKDVKNAYKKAMQENGLCILKKFSGLPTIKMTLYLN